MATRLYQNTARVHFNLHAEKDGRFGRRIIFGFFFFKQKTAYEISSRDWSSDVCSSDLIYLIFIYIFIYHLIIIQDI